jgi:hypothetical protein
MNMSQQKRSSTAGVPWDEGEHVAFLKGLHVFGKVSLRGVRWWVCFNCIGIF